MYQAPGGPEEDRGGGFEFGGWQWAYSDDETGGAIVAGVGRMDALLLGRKTYDIFAAFWPTRGDDDPIAVTFNALPNFVVSRSLTDPAWAAWMTSLPWGLLLVTPSKLVPKIQLSCSTVPARGSLRAAGSVWMTSALSLVNVSVASWGGAVVAKPCNHYSLLATSEDIFALPLLWGRGGARPHQLRTGQVQLQVLMPRKAAVMSTDVTAALPGVAG